MSSNSLEQHLGNISEFLSRIFFGLKKDNIDVSNYECDHICYRVETKERYAELKLILSQYGESLGESIINGRPIDTFKLKEPIIFDDKVVSCVELPSPKKESYYLEGLEHVEFVIDVSFDEFMKKYPDLRFDIGGISKKINPDIGIKYSGFSVKFHRNTLEYVKKYLQ